jgi:hypothetical protein
LVAVSNNEDSFASVPNHWLPTHDWLSWREK